VGRGLGTRAHVIPSQTMRSVSVGVVAVALSAFLWGCASGQPRTSSSAGPGHTSPRCGLALTGYALATATPAELGLAPDQHLSPVPLRLTLCGSGIFVHALDPTITVGGEALLDFELRPDSQAIVAFLYTHPADGAVVTIEDPAGCVAALPTALDLAQIDETSTCEAGPY